MRRFLAALILWALIGVVPAFAVPAVVQSTIGQVFNQTGGNHVVNTPSITTTAGNTLVAFYSALYQAGSNAVSTVTGPGQTWTQLIAPSVGSGTNASWGVWICENCAALSSQVVTGTETGNAVHYATLIVAEISGVATASVADLHESSVTANTTTPSFTTSGTTAQASEIALGYLGQSVFNATVTEASGWTQAQDAYSSQEPAHLGYKVLSSTGTVTYNPTLSSGGISNIAVVTLKASGAVAVCKRSLMGVGC